MVNEKVRKKILSPTIDVVFQALFGEEGSERITKDFLQTILKEEITEIDLSKNPVLRRETVNDKLGILDVIVKINGKENCDLEMQMANTENILDRILWYWSKLYSKSVQKGKDYKDLEKAIVILISKERIKVLEELEYHTKWKIMETNTCRKILTDKLEIHIIELEKIEKFKIKPKDKLLDWLEFLTNPESEGVIKKMKENESIREAKEKLDKISDDEKMQQLAWWREKAIYEENTLINNEKRKIAKKMKNDKMPIESIMKFTELTKEEIENL